VKLSASQKHPQARNNPASTAAQKLQTVEATVHTRANKVVRAEVHSDNMYSSIDDASRKLQRSLRKLKERKNKKGSKQPKEAALMTDDLVDAAAPPDEPTADQLYALLDVQESLAREKHFYIAPMTTQEAMEAISCVDHPFYVFRNAQTDDINVLYRRRNGGFGVIVPRPALPGEK